ncbi:unnamed protein product [Strongylus vulgaris]|uniref:Phorbol-ester/DAG-type domain-containing protein n=1 Tax=Strongylus vulgaris TaxID=40348 RepID=A0A3P7HWC5_STRVU|nr:unnamed protein product [Strongylus vulgaris]
MDNEQYTIKVLGKIDELKSNLTQVESAYRSAIRQVEELKKDNANLQEQITVGKARERETTEENKKLRGGLTDALVKIDQYKKEAEMAKETCHEMAEQVANNEERMNKLEDEVINLEEVLREKEKLEAYLQSQIKAKDLPKLSRRSTLLRTPTESSLEIIDADVVEELENEKSSLLKELEEKKKGDFTPRFTEAFKSFFVLLLELDLRKKLPPPVPKGYRTQPSAPHSNILTEHPMAELQSKSVSEIRCTPYQHSKAATIGTPQKGMMRHDIPHRWTELRHFGLFSIKCAVCFIGVPTFGKKKRCTHCGIIVHSQCASRVVNTCGLPDQCANFYLDSYSAPNGKMNGWVRMFRDDSNTREWQSVWGEMDEKRLVFYDHDAAQSDLRKQCLSIDLEKELRLVRVGSEVPGVKTDSAQISHNIVHVRTETRNVYILAPSIQTAKRWAEALQNASTRKMMLTRRPSSFSEQSCVLVLSTPNNLTIHTICVFDEYFLIGAQSGLFFTYMSGPRVPLRISGFNSVTAIECLPNLNILAFIMDHRRILALVPLSTLKSELHSVQPGLRADILGGYDNLHALAYHQQNGNQYLCAAGSTKIHVLKYNAARDVIETNEPAMCLTSSNHGLYFGSDSFYFVQFGRGQLEPLRVADSNIADYPIALLTIGEDEVLLAYQNYGAFVNSRGERTRSQTVEWEQMPMEFVFTAPYLYVVHYDSIEIMQVAEYTGLDSRTILDEREVYECRNAHVVCCRPNGDVYISISNTDSVEVHRFNATISKRGAMKRKGLSLSTYDKRSKVVL